MDYNETDYNNNNYSNDNDNYDYHYDDHQDQGGGSSSTKGLKIAIIILGIVLAGLAVLYFLQVRSIQRDFDSERDTLETRITAMMGEMGDMKVTNDTLNLEITAQRQVADSLLNRLKSERNLSYSKMKAYEREIGTLRATMQGFIRQIDSLNRLNQVLVGENLQLRRENTDVRQRMQMAEETATEQASMLKRGSVLRARDIRLVALNSSEKEVSRIKQAVKLETRFVISANEFATPGTRTVYIRIIMPDAEILGNPSRSTFKFEGDNIVYSAKRDVQYENDDLPVSIYFDCKDMGLYSGVYEVMIYADGYMIGKAELILNK